MTTENQTESQTTSFLDMSDEDMMKVNPALFQVEVAASTAAEVLDAETTNTETSTDGEGEGESATDTGTDGTDGAAEGEGEGSAGAEGSAEAEDKGQTTEVTDETAAEGQANEGKAKAAVSDPAKTEATAEVAEPVDYKAIVDKLFSPIKANGREIKVENIDDAISLMQMGLNYNKKMAAIKPNLRLMKMLETNGLLDEAKLGFLIDLDKKNPEAINKLVKDSGIDPLDMSATKAGEYKPGNHSVDEQALELDTVLSELEDSPGYGRTLNVVSKVWDGASKAAVAAKPELLKVINSHVESGIYDMITTVIERERTFGRLKGMSDIEAYRQVGDAMQERGEFAKLGSQQQTQTPNATVVVPPKPKQVDEGKVKDQKRAASSTKTTVPSAAAKTDFSPLGMSDDEFMKQSNSKYL